MILAILFGIVCNLTLQILCLHVFYHVKKTKESEYFTDYVHGSLILRVFKPEFEYQAIGNVPLDKILDRGTLTQFYLWALIEK